jgi:hypothetical protein
MNYLSFRPPGPAISIICHPEIEIQVESYHARRSPVKRVLGSVGSAHAAAPRLTKVSIHRARVAGIVSSGSTSFSKSSTPPPLDPLPAHVRRPQAADRRRVAAPAPGGFPPPFHCRAQCRGRRRRVLKEIQNPDAVTNTQRDAIVARDDLFGSG